MYDGTVRNELVKLMSVKDPYYEWDSKLASQVRDPRVFYCWRERWRMGGGANVESVAQGSDNLGLHIIWLTLLPFRDILLPNVFPPLIAH